MDCPHCASDTHEFDGSLDLCFGGLRNVDIPGFLMFPKLSVCLNCGFSRFTIPETELALL
jgi:hypothetical protein